MSRAFVKGEERFAQANETIQWIVSSDERRELGRAAGRRCSKRRRIGGVITVNQYRRNGLKFAVAPLILINRGDEKNREKLESLKREKPFKALVALFGYAISFGFNIAAGICTHLFGY